MHMSIYHLDKILPMLDHANNNLPIHVSVILVAIGNVKPISNVPFMPQERFLTCSSHKFVLLKIQLKINKMKPKATCSKKWL